MMGFKEKHKIPIGSRAEMKKICKRHEFLREEIEASLERLQSRDGGGEWQIAKSE